MEAADVLCRDETFKGELSAQPNLDAPQEERMRQSTSPEGGGTAQEEIRTHFELPSSV